MKFEISSKLEVDPDEFRRMLTLRGVNTELSPLVRMTAPSEWSSRPIVEWPTGRTLFSSWILLFGIVPVDRHSFYLKSIDSRRGFVEESSSLVNSLWRHHRYFDQSGETCEVTDTLEFECRLPLLARLLAPVYRFVFRHRHKVLRRNYSGYAS